MNNGQAEEQKQEEEEIDKEKEDEERGCTFGVSTFATCTWKGLCKSRSQAKKAGKHNPQNCNMN